MSDQEFIERAAIAALGGMMARDSADVINSPNWTVKFCWDMAIVLFKQRHDALNKVLK